MSANRSIVIRPAGERGVALVMTLLVMALMSALMIGFGSVVTSDQRYRYIDRDRVRAFYAAQSGLEKLSADLANLFFENVAPTPQDIADLGVNPPAVPNVTFTTGSEGGVAYGATYIPPEPGETEWNHISSGPYEGLIALKKRYWLDSSVRTTAGGEAHLKRNIETVSIPVFQFGIFSDVDLSFSAADTFDFRGRVHTNSNLFLAQGGTTCTPSPCTLWLRDRVTAVKEIIRQRLSNTASIDAGPSTQRVRVATAPGNAFRDLARTEGSVSDGAGSPANAAWPTLSLSSYNGYMRTGKTGAKQLNLPLIKADVGGANIDLIRRPKENGQEKSEMLAERYFSKVSLRVLLSDTAQDILKLPTVTQTAPVSLEGDWVNNAGNRPVGYGNALGQIDVAHPPVARVPANAAATTELNVDVAAGVNRPLPIQDAGPFNGQMPAYFRLPDLNVTNAAGAVQLVRCTGKTATTFMGCANVAGAAVAGAPTTVSATVDGVPRSVTYQTFVAGTITLVNGSTTHDFAPGTFWVLNGANGNNTNVLVSCDGYDTVLNPDQFTGCNVPGVAGTNPLQDGAVITSGSLTNAMSTIGGFIKIEMQDTNETWRDVTMEILNWGFGGPNLNPVNANNMGRLCADPTPNAIVRLQRLQENVETVTAPATPCSYSDVPRATYYVPNVLFDTREAIYRDAVPATGQPRLGGVMHYVALDVANLSGWFAGTGVYNNGSGPQALSRNGYSVYFSDRRGNRNATNQETGEYGFEDVVNPNSATGVPSNTLNGGEDMNASLTLETYGQFPSYNGVYNSVPPGALDALTQANARPLRDIRAPYAQVNRAVLFRRALKLVNGGLNNIVAPGLTVAAENPTYIQGDWNASQAGFVEPNVATSVAADSVTLLSNVWNDNASFTSPYVTNGRVRAVNTFYRVAIISGKGPIFPRPANGEGPTFGTDGGVHSFLRFLEGGGGNTVSYRGSMATLYYHRQAISPFKCCNAIVYDVPRRAYAFDLDFLDPALLPPLTPMFRDLNALGFTQETRPGK